MQSFIKSFPIIISFFILAACVTTATPSPSTRTDGVNLDAATQTLIANAERVVFVIPFSHWDTDWHEGFPDYVKRSDGNILAAIQMTKKDSRFRFTLEQVFFVQHFWETYPQHRNDLKAYIQNRQLTFAWAGLVQPETSLAAPAIQVRNLQLGGDWIAEKFGKEYVPRSAWQSDAFGNSAALPTFLNTFSIPYLFIGRSQFRCDPADTTCKPLPHIFYWKSPLNDRRVLVTYLAYPNAWDSIHRLPDEAQQIAELRKVVDGQFQRGDSKYIFLPMGSDFIDPLPNISSLVDKWNAADQKTVLVMADPETAFDYIAKQSNVPEFKVDLNPIWQAFYATRPYAKIADKESEYFLTAADKFGLMIDAPPPTAWQLAAVNAHYDNIGAVSFDKVWATYQLPRFEKTLSDAANDLAGIVARIASAVNAPVIIFNPLSWARSEVIEIKNDSLDLSKLPTPVQLIAPDTVAIYAENIPSVGYASLTSKEIKITNAASVSPGSGGVTLSNGLVSVSLDNRHGGTFSSLKWVGGAERIAPNVFADDVAYRTDSGDVYGAFFGDEIARESQTTAQIKILAEGPLLARVQATFTLGGQALTKTVTLRADSPLIEVALEIKALPETSAILHSPLMINTKTRTDDLGFAAFNHELDNKAIAAGDVTYRRKIFYPIMYWSDVSDSDGGVSVITHGIQGLGGANALNLLLVRQVTDKGDEGVTDTDYHTLRYAYLPHAAVAPDLWRWAYQFNQPLLAAWRVGDRFNVQIPFANRIYKIPLTASATPLPATSSLLSAQSGFVSDIYRRGTGIEAIIIDYDPSTAVTLTIGSKQTTLAPAPLIVVPIEIKD